MTPSDSSSPVTTKTCKRGHVFSGSYGCSVCQKERAHIWHLNNKERGAKRLKKWRNENRERFNKNQREYVGKRREKVNEYATKWYHKNSGRILERKAELTRKDRIPGIWRGMVNRCTKPNAIGYENYGGRGIKVCERWLGTEGRANFRADMGSPPTAKHSLDRKDVNGDYEIGNCRWATSKEQGANKRTTRKVEFNGRVLCLTEWAAETGIPWGTINRRLTKWGWSVEKALTEPPSEMYRSHKEMCKTAVRWLVNEIGCEIATDQAVSGRVGGERPDAIGWKDGVSYLIECKTKRTNFLQDASKLVRREPSKGVGRLRYYLCPAGLIRPDEVPDGWGVLYFGLSVSVVKEASPFPSWNEDGENEIMESYRRRVRGGRSAQSD